MAVYRKKQLWQGLLKYIQDNLGIYLFVMLLFVMGTIFGALAIKTLNVQQKAELFDYLEIFIQGIKPPFVLGEDSILQDSITGNLKTIGLLWLLGPIVIGLPLVLVVIFTKGFSVGFTVGFLVNELGIKGILFSIATVLPPALFIIPALVVMAAASISFSMAVIRKRLLRHNIKMYPKRLVSYSFLALLTAAIGIFASLVEIYVCPVFIGLFTKWVF